MAENKNSVSLNYGPLTFSLKIKERYEMLDGTSEGLPWEIPIGKQGPILPIGLPTISILIRTGAMDWSIRTRSISAHSNFSAEVGPKTTPLTADAVPYSVKLEAKRIPDWRIDQYQLTAPLPFSPVPSDVEAETIEMIPMGAARLRLSALPTVDK